MIKKISTISLTILLVWAVAQSGKESTVVAEKVTKTDAEWQTCLTPEEYRVLREKGTEQAFTGKYYKHKEKGTYLCAGCDAELFSSDTKFDSGTGWPSFFKALDKTKITYKEDNSLLMKRIEILCAKCNSHLGHVFDDGPNPTGKRYCVNSVSLDFEKAKE